MTSAANFTPKSAILSFVLTHELLTMRLFLDSLANKYFRMKISKKTIELICELERLVGKQCYNPQSYNGYTGEEGCIMRYPVYYCNKDGEDCKTKILVKDITKNCIGSIHYKFGANHLYIGDAIVDMLNYIEDKYNIDFNEIVKNKK